MIYYPLSVLLLAGIREILIITTREDQKRFQKLLGDGSSLGISIQYTIQSAPRGLAEAFLLAEAFIDQEPFALILGDNLFYGHDLPKLLEKGIQITSGGMIFGYHVKDPHRYGVVEFDSFGKVLSLEEKPLHPKSSYAVPGLYFYGPEVISIAKTLKPSKRGELEITDVHQRLLERKALLVELMGRGFAWLDTGTFNSFYKASQFVETIQDRQGVKIACIEEIAYRKGFISREKLLSLAKNLQKSTYGTYLRQVALETAQMPILV